MLHDATLRLPVEITTSVFALALLALFSQPKFLLNLRKLNSLRKAVSDSLAVFQQLTWLQKKR